MTSASLQQMSGSGSPGSRAQRSVAAKPGPAIAYWAIAGGLLVCFIGYVWCRWITGPYFETVPAGPTKAPGWMMVTLVVWQICGLFVAAGFLYGFLARPLIRERRLTADGLLIVAFCTLWFQDPLSAYFGHWFVYNANLVNYGFWVADVPGWNSFAQPGAMIPEPILLIGPVYVRFVMISTLIGCWAMRTAKSRWPALSGIGLVAICFGVMCAMDIVAEGLVLLPLSFWEYPGGPGLMFSDAYHKFPINELLTIGALMTCMSALRYFKDDRGYTLVERGAERVASPARRNVMRLLAVTFAAHSIVFICYNLPNALVGAHSTEWPSDLRKRSYFTNGICGAGTGPACPGPGVPLDRNRGDGVAHVTPDGKVVAPEPGAISDPIPFDPN